MLNFCQTQILDIRPLSVFPISVFFMLSFGPATANGLEGEMWAEQKFVSRPAGDIAIANINAINFKTVATNSDSALEAFCFAPTCKKALAVAFNLINPNPAITTN